jgi:DNA-binding response OmpR family regulator
MKNDMISEGKSNVNVRVMVVEDEFIIALDLKDTIKSLGFDVPAIATSGQQAVETALKHKPDLILMDIMLKGDIDGIEAAGEISKSLEIPIVFISSFSDESSIKRAFKVSRYGYLIKPFHTEELKYAIEEALRKHEEKNYRRLKKDSSKQFTKHT